MDKKSPVFQNFVGKVWKIVKDALYKNPNDLKPKQIAFLMNSEESTVYKWAKPKEQGGNEISLNELVRMSYVTQDEKIGQRVAEMFYKKK
jgi:hypothetical protein